MTVGNLIVILTALAAVVTILTWLGITVNGRALIGRIRAWIEQPRKEREALAQRVATLEGKIEALNAALGTSGESNTTEVNTLKEQSTQLKQRIDDYGKKLAHTEETVFNNVKELDAIGNKQKQVEQQLESYVQMLIEAREQIGDLRHADAKIDSDARQASRALDERLGRLQKIVSDLAAWQDKQQQ